MKSGQISYLILFMEVNFAFDEGGIENHHYLPAFSDALLMIQVSQRNVIKCFVNLWRKKHCAGRQAPADNCVSGV